MTGSAALVFIAGGYAETVGSGIARRGEAGAIRIGVPGEGWVAFRKSAPVDGEGLPEALVERMQMDERFGSELDALARVTEQLDVLEMRERETGRTSRTPREGI